MARILLLNGSGHQHDELSEAFNEMIRIFETAGMESELIQIGHQAIRGCVDCGSCAEQGKCVFESDSVNAFAEKFETADALIVGSPIYCNSPSGTVISFLDRLFRSTPFSKELKVGGCLVQSGENGGFVSGIDVLNHYFGAAGMKIASVSFWDQADGDLPDGETSLLKQARDLAGSVIGKIREIAAAAETGEKPETEDDYITRFVDGNFRQLRKRPIPLFILDEDHPGFPDPQYTGDTGFLAVGGDVTPEWLVAAYSRGIIPWTDEGAPLMWYCPLNRFVILPSELHVSKKMARFMRNHTVTLSINRDFADTMHQCRMKRERTGEETWIDDEVEEAYLALWEKGYAYSVEAFVDGELAGGQYGIRIGGCIIGESMFSLQPDGSKMCLALLLRYMEEHGFPMVDCQVPSEYLRRMGGKTISYGEYMRFIRQGLQEHPTPEEWKVEGYQKGW